MANLTTSWQEIGRVTFYSSGTISDTIALETRYTGQSIENNTTHVEVRIVNVGNSWRTSNGTVSFTGEFTYSVGCATYPNYINQGDEISIAGHDVPHDENGDRYIYVGATISAVINGATRTGTIPQTYISLPHINRYATITNAVDFNDEGTPTLTFSNPAGYRINARLEFAESFINRENISNTGTYSFNLTTAERNLLRQKCTGKTLTITYVLATCYTETTEAHTETINKTMSIVNANPTFNVTYQDSNSTTTAITQNNQQIIQNNSTLQFNITNATAYKYASLSSVSITINGVTQTQSISSSTLSFNYGTINVSSNTTANIVLTDSRGFTKTANVNLTILSWETPSAIITLNRKSNYYTETDINVDAKYSSLNSKNTIAIKYRIKKKSDSTWGSYANLSDNVTTTFNADNLYEWDVQVVVNDLLGSVTYNLSLGIGTPILFIDRVNRNVGIECFAQSSNALEVKGTAQVNGDLIVADTNGNNPVNVINRMQTINTNLSTRIEGYGEFCKNVSGNNWNTICGNKSGFYMGDSMSNSPTQGWVYVIHIVHNNLFARQIAFDFFSYSIYTRPYINGTWYNWEQIH